MLNVGICQVTVSYIVVRSSVSQEVIRCIINCLCTLPLISVTISSCWGKKNSSLFINICLQLSLISFHTLYVSRIHLNYVP